MKILPSDYWIHDFDSGGSVLRRGVSNIFVAASAQGLKLAMNLGSTILLVRLLDPGDFGLFAMVAVVYNFLIIFKDVGLSSATIQRAKITQEQMTAVFWLNQIAGGVFLLLVVLMTPLLSFVFSNTAIIPGLLALGLCFPVSAFAAQHDALLRRFLKFKSLAVVDIFSTAGSYIASLLLAVGGFGWWALLLQRMIQIALSSILLWCVCSWRPSRSVNLKEAKEHIGLGAHVSASNLFSYLSRNLDNILVGSRLGKDQLGLYAKPYDIVVGTVMQISTPLGQVAQSLFARTYSDFEKYARIVCVFCTGANFAVVPFAVVLIMTAPSFVGVVLGDGWSQSIGVVQWLGLASAFQVGGAVLTWTLIAEGRGRDLTLMSMLSGLLNIGGFIFSVRYGIAAVAATYAIMGVIARMPLAIFFASRGSLTLMQAARPLILTSLALAIGITINLLLENYFADESQSEMMKILASFVSGLVAVVITSLLSKDMRFVMLRSLDVVRNMVRSGQ